MIRLVVVFGLMLSIVGCRDKLHIERITDPEYPVPARFKNAQGTVFVKVSIGADGRVIYAEGSGAPQVFFNGVEYKGAGAPDVLVKAAEENAKGWTFGPFPPVCEFPIEHVIEYVYKLEGKPLVIALSPAIKTHLPDRIEISAVPMVSDYPVSESHKPAANPK